MYKFYMSRLIISTVVCRNCKIAFWSCFKSAYSVQITFTLDFHFKTKGSVELLDFYFLY